MFVDDKNVECSKERFLELSASVDRVVASEFLEYEEGARWYFIWARYSGCHRPPFEVTIDSTDKDRHGYRKLCADRAAAIAEVARLRNAVEQGSPIAVDIPV